MDRYLADPDGLVEALKGQRVDCILAMCSRPEHVSATLPGLRAAFDGPIGAYANIGYLYHTTADDDLFGSTRRTATPDTAGAGSTSAPKWSADAAPPDPSISRPSGP